MRSILLALVSILAAVRPAAALDLTGVVLESIDAAPYTILRLDTAVGEKWAAIPSTAIAKGASVRIRVAASRQGFESKELGRTFERMTFGSLAGSEARVVVPERATVKVDKAPGPDGRTVAEIHALKAELKGQEVLLRAEVVKITPEVNGLDWVHLRDGTGDAGTGDHDLTATTKDTTLKVGQVVLVRGRVVLDKDMGGRYKFPVLLDGAALVR